MRLVRPRSVPAATASTTFVQPGTVGYLGSTGALTVIDSANPYTGSGGSTWNSTDGNVFSQTNLTLDHVWVKTSMAWSGTGTLTLTNSILEGGSGDYCVFAAANSAVVINATDCTFRWPASPTFPITSDTANIRLNVPSRQNLLRCDISGQPHGVEIRGSNTSVDSCWIHDLVWNPDTDPHLDGIFLFGGTNVQVLRNYINVNDANSVHTTAALFLQDTFSDGMASPTINGNYLCGGANSLFIQAGSNIVCTNNTIDTGFFGDLSFEAPATIATWSNNKHSDGTTIPSP